MASPVAAAILNLLSGGTQGYAQTRRRLGEQAAAKKEADTERAFRAQQTEAEVSASERAAASEQAFRQSESETSRKENIRQFDIEQKRLGEAQTREDKYRSDLLKQSTTVEQLQARIARLQQDTAEEKFDPFLQIQKAVAEVYTKNATGDDPTIAGQVATKAAMDLYLIYQSLGIIPTPLGPPGDTPRLQAPGSGTSIRQEEEPLGILFPGLFSVGFGRTPRFGKAASDLADTLRTLESVRR